MTDGTSTRPETEGQTDDTSDRLDRIEAALAECCKIVDENGTLLNELLESASADFERLSAATGVTRRPGDES